MTTILSVLLLIWLIPGTWILGRKTPDYYPLRQTISELGASGAEHEKVARFALFLPSGLLATLISFLFLLESHLEAAALAASVAIGYLFAAIFPVDQGAPLHGSRANFWHNLGGMVMYLGGGLSLIAAHQQAPGFTMAGVFSLVGLAGLSPYTPTRYRGWLQRLIEALFFAALISHSLF
ncbi:uncharacterized protein DUF998 [Halospina denitrificans]|uniref:Uncharacterized protein DUF998 n=1 Tax=Halospina denitrificans TaxID=332522 RepID=A0A4R7JIQ5_9GAMM|nr:DUF998 domain-containing protein [Halospina denitrificans]TDT37792.1 uncharacterized protein DUF998 [Halospina denitrificans]